MTVDVDNLFICLLTIWMSFFVKCQLTSFVHFSNELSVFYISISICLSTYLSSIYLSIIYLSIIYLSIILWYQSFVRYVHYIYFLPVHGLSFILLMMSFNGQFLILMKSNSSILPLWFLCLLRNLCLSHFTNFLILISGTHIYPCLF